MVEKIIVLLYLLSLNNNIYMFKLQLYFKLSNARLHWGSIDSNNKFNVQVKKMHNIGHEYLFKTIK